jgi:hypothetical protein
MIIELSDKEIKLILQGLEKLTYDYPEREIDWLIIRLQRPR